ncbi:MAG: hypothetical protein ACJ8AI_14335 [Rhodopila sp.]
MKPVDPVDATVPPMKISDAAVTPSVPPAARTDVPVWVNLPAEKTLASDVTMIAPPVWLNPPDEADDPAHPATPVPLPIVSAPPMPMIPALCDTLPNQASPLLRLCRRSAPTIR